MPKVHAERAFDANIGLDAEKTVEDLYVKNSGKS